MTVLNLLVALSCLASPPSAPASTVTVAPWEAVYTPFKLGGEYATIRIFHNGKKVASFIAQCSHAENVKRSLAKLTREKLTRMQETIANDQELIGAVYIMGDALQWDRRNSDDATHKPHWRIRPNDPLMREVHQAADRLIQIYLEDIARDARREWQQLGDIP